MQGWVEQFDENAGIVGWAVDASEPDRTLTIELWGGRELIASTETGIARPDVVEAVGVETRAGFRFDASVGDKIRKAASFGLSGELVVRIAGTEDALPSFAGPRTLELVRLSGAGGRPNSRERLLERLSHYVTVAEGLLDQPLKPTQDRTLGYIESVSADEGGLVWLIGWMNLDVAVDQPMMVVDNAKHPAGFAAAFAPRADLPDTARAFVGVLQTEWRPSPSLQPFLFLCDGTARHLSCVQPTPVLSKEAMAPLVAAILSRADGGFPDIIRDQFRVTSSWAVGAGDPHDRIAVDEMAILPGFGAFVTGWALSPVRDWNTVVLRTGNQVMVAEERTLTRRPRADLVGIYPGADRAVTKAGFVATFRGDVALDRLDNMVLKLVWQDGSSTNAAIGSDRVRVLGTTAPLDRAHLYYPSVESEPFFADFAQHAANSARAAARLATPFAIDQARGAVVLVAPPARSDAFLLVENAMTWATALPPDDGLVILARPGEDRAATVKLFAELKQATGRACSLFFVADPLAAAYAIESVAEQVGLERFAFVGAGTMLTAAGWRAAASGDARLTLFEVIDPAADRSAPGIVGLNAFATRVEDWTALAGKMPTRLDGPGATAVPGEMRDTAQIVRRAALMLRDATTAPFVQRVNAAIASAHG